MLATSEGSFSNGTQAGEFSASVCLPKMLAALHSRRKIEFNFCPECRAKPPRLSQMAFREKKIRSQAPLVPPTWGDEARRWLDHAGRAHSNEERHSSSARKMRSNSNGISPNQQMWGRIRPKHSHPGSAGGS